ncbi:hypothetical protein RHSIM_Rhsim07G0132700 [Rhododendron simsii]|uniref:Uncharacterized protein n=1 Tax=Rhododendron simsii TaxID=118357 RepID=A0A834GQU6_RHOSS|nr:hypothetical protein RHSIM_Rhsim07G0132700 [Rhododendron simsii]
MDNVDKDLEAGGVVIDAGGNPLDFSKGRCLDLDTGIIVTNPKLMPMLLKAVRESLDEKASSLKCEERRIRVTNTLDVLADDVADVATGLALATLRKICWVLTRVRNTLAAVTSIGGDRELLRKTRRPHPPAHHDDRLQDCVNCVIVDPRRKQTSQSGRKYLWLWEPKQLLAGLPLTLIRLPLLDYVIDDLFQTCFSSLLWILFFRNRIHPTGIVVLDFQQCVGYSLVDLITTITMRRLVTYHHLHQ